MAKIYLALLLLLFVFGVISAPTQDEVKELKGYYNFSSQFKMYSGYLTIQQSPLIKSYYLFLTSKNDPQNDDLVLWSNGGPGCSSLLGFSQELGPHLLNQGSQHFSKSINPYTWNAKANMIFFETPPGVGYSINEDTSYLYNDTRTATDNLLTLKAWFAKFPEFSKNKFWISGQSYCGMYLPLFADQILKNKGSIIPSQPLDFQGMLIGNGVMVTSLPWRRKARDMFYSRHYFYGTQANNLLSTCQYNSSDSANPSCTIGKKLGDETVKRINPYNSIGICYVNKQQSIKGLKNQRFWYTAFDEQMYNMVESQPGCSSDHSGLSAFFNDATVRQQLHITTNKAWQPCSSHIGSTYKKDAETIHLFNSFKQNKLKVLLFTGNVDAQVSYVETEEYIKQIGWRQTGQKKAVVNDRSSLMGWYEEYDGLTYYIVNGAGHMVPGDKPHAAQQMFQWFLSKR